MPVTKTLLKSATQECVVKVAGTAAASTITLATDLLVPNPVPTGTIVTNSASTTVTGVNTGFLTLFGSGTTSAGVALFSAANVYIGLIATVTTDTALTLAGNAAITLGTTSAYKVAAGVDGSTQTVNIVSVCWSGANNGIIEISRNSVIIMTLQANAAGSFEFGGQLMIPDNIENTKDIVITVSGGQAELWMRLRKVSGYKVSTELANFGSYDNPLVPGM